MTDDNRCWECGDCATRRHPDANCAVVRGCGECFPEWPRTLRLIHGARTTTPREAAPEESTT